MQAAGIVLTGVEKHHGSFQAVKGVDLVIKPGEFFSMLGPSGCGKTTTLRMIAGFETPTRGSIHIGNDDVSQVPPEGRPVNMVFQNYALFPNMSVRENIAFGLRSKGIRKPEMNERVNEMLEVTKLQQFAHRRPKQLSGGQQQRVALARALVNRPQALLLDEPLGALDLMIRRHMQAELKRLQREFAITFVYVTHDQEEALALSDRIAVMRDGLIAQCGTPLEIYSRPASREVAAFVGEMNFFDGKVASSSNGGKVLQLGDGFVSVISPRITENFKAGDAATLAVRPEDIVLKETPDGTLISGVVQQIMFLGSSAKVELRLSSGHDLNAQVSASATLPKVGERAYVSWNESKTHIFRG